MNATVGDLVWAFIKSADQIDPVEGAARAGRISGVWFLRSEMDSPGDTAALINRLQSASPRPLLVGVDAEAGLGHVMGGATELPNAMAQGATGDPEYAREAARVTALEAAACGINVIAAPVLDVNINAANPIINTRSFGGDPAAVARMGAAYIAGTLDARTTVSRVLPIGKHFPGHGDTSQDSHLELGTVDAYRDRLEEIELVPFAAAISAGVPLLMTAHVAYPALDPSGTPATLSYRILTDLLRHTLGYRGAVVTDALDMYAIAHNFAVGEAAVEAVLAGNDLLLTDQFELVYDALHAAVESGTVPQSRLRAATARVSSVRTHIFGTAHTAPAAVEPGEADRNVGTAAAQDVAERIAAASITLVNGSVTEFNHRPLLLATQMSGWPRISVEPRLREVLDSEGWHDAQLLMLDADPHGAEYEEAMVRAARAESVALLHFNGVSSYEPDAVGASDELVSLANDIAHAGVSLTIISLGSPYALTRFPQADARLCSYSTCVASVRAVIRVLMGRAGPSGRLPVQLHDEPQIPAHSNVEHH